MNGRVLSAPQARIVLSGAADLVIRLLPLLIGVFAARQNAALRQDRDDANRVPLYFKRYPGGRPVPNLTLHQTSSDGALADLVANAADIAVSRRKPNAAKWRLARQAGRGDLSTPARGRTTAPDAVPAETSAARDTGPLAVSDLPVILSSDNTDRSQFGAQPGLINVHAVAAKLMAVRDALGRGGGADILSSVILHLMSWGPDRAVADDPAASPR